MFFVQPKFSFGDVLCEELQSSENGNQKWEIFEFAVAWLNRAGAHKLANAVEKFIAAKGYIYATVGLDFGSTTFEALSILLDIEDNFGGIETHVFFDENSVCTFHPKVFVFRNTKEARLFVGSNNLTGAGLQTNIEACFGFSGSIGDVAINEARKALADWRNVNNENRVLRLNRELLLQLRDRGYVLNEAALRKHRKIQERAPRTKEERLFGRSKVSIPKYSPLQRRLQPNSVDGTRTVAGLTLLMRVRPRRNGNQLQISLSIHANFMRNSKWIASTDGSQKEIGFNEARGKKNTARFEAPELRGMENPVARFYWSSGKNLEPSLHDVLNYEIFDANTDAAGKQIFSKLKKGIQKKPSTNLSDLAPGITVLSKSNRDISQWYLLDSV